MPASRIRTGLTATWLVAIGLWLGVPGVAGSAEAGSAFTGEERAAIVSVLRSADDLADGSPETLDDAALRVSAIRYATAMLGLRLPPASVNRLWAIAPPRHDVATDLDAARTSGRLTPWLQGLTPPDRRYTALAAWRGRYRAIAAAGGWPLVGEGKPLSAGAQGAAVAALRQRLAIEEAGPSAAAADDRFDGTLTAALLRFQRRHGLTADGVVGPATRRELNVSAAARLQQLDANLERWRWVRGLPPTRIEVDAAGAVATLYQAGVARLSMRVIVGDPKHQTPMFASRINAVVVNPPWNVPTSIATKELYPKEAAHPGYLARNHFRRVEGGLQQAPGADNALGLLKFDMASPFGVYLHDTPAKAAFLREHRQLSHGCIRLQEPRGLAVLLLSPQGWETARIEAAIAAGATQRIELAQPTPVYVLYWTAGVDEAGSLEFRPDPYGWDAELTEALASSGPLPQNQHAAP